MRRFLVSTYNWVIGKATFNLDSISPSPTGPSRPLNGLCFTAATGGARFCCTGRSFPDVRDRFTVQHSDREVDHVEASEENTLELLETWFSTACASALRHSYKRSTASAVTVFFLFALQATSSLRIAHASLRAALLQVEQCLRYLDEMGQAWECAARTRDRLKSVLYNKFRPIIKKRLAAHKGVRRRRRSMAAGRRRRGG